MLWLHPSYDHLLKRPFKKLKLKPMTDPNESIFTTEAIGFGHQLVNGHNLTKREYFAAMALQGLLANTSIIPNSDNIDYAVECSVMAANELINQLNKIPSNE